MSDGNAVNGRGSGAAVDEDRLSAARRDLIAAIDGAEPGADNEAAGDPDGLAKVGEVGLSIELRLNGQTIALEGKPVNQIAPDAFRAFLDRQRLAIDAGEMDEAVRAALAQPGPDKALVRVRAIDAD